MSDGKRKDDTARYTLAQKIASKRNPPQTDGRVVKDILVKEFIQGLVIGFLAGALAAWFMLA